ncbi:MAG TPA: hypothetical protein PLQ35_04465 [bacterium]|nr:hypothetical protein [bacterium]
MNSLDTIVIAKRGNLAVGTRKPEIATSPPFADSGRLLAMTEWAPPPRDHAFFVQITGPAGGRLAMTEWPVEAIQLQDTRK